MEQIINEKTSVGMPIGLVGVLNLKTSEGISLNGVVGEMISDEYMLPVCIGGGSGGMKLEQDYGFINSKNINWPNNDGITPGYCIGAGSGDIKLGGIHNFSTETFITPEYIKGGLKFKEFAITKTGGMRLGEERTGISLDEKSIISRIDEKQIITLH